MNQNDTNNTYATKYYTIDNNGKAFLKINISGKFFKIVIFSKSWIIVTKIFQFIIIKINEFLLHFSKNWKIFQTF